MVFIRTYITGDRSRASFNSLFALDSLNMACMGGKGTQFHKYQGLGNDFILVDHTKGPSALTLTPAEYSFAKYCNRNYGVGADGLIFVMPGQHECDYTMLIYNSDGTQPQMCGNGIRCMARYIHEVIENQQQNFKEVTYKIWTGAGVIIPRLRPDGQIEVDMGYPIFNPSLVPTTLPTTNVMWNEREEGDIGAVVNAPIEICTSTGEKTTFLATAVGFGNPHVVVFVDDLDDMQVSLSLSLRFKGYFYVLMASYVIWSAALDSSGVLLSYNITSLASHTIIMLISTLF